MKTTTKLIIWLFIVSLVGIGGWKFVRPHVTKFFQKRISDAKATKGRINIAVDDWVGYFPARSKRLKKEMLEKAYLVDCQNDNADYPARMKHIADGAVNMAMFTVDADVLNGAALSYPGLIITVIDESKGGDAIVAYTNEVASLDDLRNNVTKKIAFTPDSPSAHLIKVAGVDFDIPFFRAKNSSLKVLANGSDDAFTKLKKHDVSIAVLWEPQVSKALAMPGIGKLLGSERTSHVIVDVLMVNKDFMVSHPEIVTEFLRTYFHVLKYYSDNPSDLVKELADEQHVDQASAATMVKGVSWVNLTENAREWFGVESAQLAGSIPHHALTDTIDGVVGVLRQVGDIDHNPIPDENPLMLTKSDFIADLFASAVKVGFDVNSQRSGGVAQFAALSDDQWLKMKEVGTLKVEPIKFQSGTDELMLEGKEAIDQIADKMKRYPNFRIGVRGHSDIKGDADANRELSLTRAQAVARYLEVTYGIDENRVHAEGLGGTKPLSRVPGESDRAYSYRLPRVEVVLLMDTY
jgi:outer membrane protein OmpA-like peptidoglycan-associated protein/ABC-type nitrate/sulfonate/bicarbonate transport system substrate-binding protein